ncbi:MAG TPA: hypothetical protein VII13_14955 [Vicinamibacteria bacterium]|jgi:hypothetical protein
MRRPALLALVLAACGGGGGAPLAPVAPPILQEPRITLTASGVSPTTLHAAAGVPVTFVNADTVAHEVRSDRHPTHAECAVLEVGVLAPGQTRDIIVSIGQGCGYHAEDDPGNRAFQGYIVGH